MKADQVGSRPSLYEYSQRTTGVPAFTGVVELGTLPITQLLIAARVLTGTRLIAADGGPQYPLPASRHPRYSTTTVVPYTLVSAAEVSQAPAETSAQLPPFRRYWYLVAVPEATEKPAPAWMSNCPEAS